MLDQATSTLSSSDPRLLVGLGTADDAGVVRLDAETALVQTVDFFTPIVDDPYVFGAIAAANALSDVYAMGGRPLSALNIVGFPDRDLPVEILTEILRGGADKLRESGAVLAGGHSVRDAELKYGLAVTGLIHPDRIWTNAAATPGLALVLTQPLGTGILTTARKRDVIDDDVLAPAITEMLRLNAAAADAARQGAVAAATDVTGFGLAGHTWEMARGASVTIRIFWSALPVFSEVLRLAEAGCVPGGARSNRQFLGEHLRVHGLTAAEEAILVDPQTSGGLLLAIPLEQADGLVARLQERGLTAACMGEVLEGPAQIEVVR